MKKKVDFKQRDNQDKKDDLSYLMEIISADIRKTTKDPFISQVLNTQIINNFVFK